MPDNPAEDTRLLLDVVGGFDEVEVVGGVDLVVDSTVLDSVVAVVVVDSGVADAEVVVLWVVGVGCALLVVGVADELVVEAELRVTGRSGISVLAVLLGGSRPGTVTGGRRDVGPSTAAGVSDVETVVGAD